MPYPAGHREQIRRTIIQSARMLFNRHGFENVSIDQIMAAAGLTRGGFYRHFESKSDLYVEVLSCFFTDRSWINNWPGVEIDLDAALVGPQVVRAYLSHAHFESVEDSCPMVTLPSDVAREGPRAKRAFETVFRAIAAFLQGDLRNRSFRGPATAHAIAALCIGGMVVARALDDRALADELREACASVAFKLGGWRRSAKRRKSCRNGP